MAAANQRWVAGLEQYEPVLDALETAGKPTRVGTAPLESVFGVREIPVETAAAYEQ
jgi:hypothetical protein